jgi:hypothetical protein
VKTTAPEATEPVVTEANALGTAYLRAQTLAEPNRTPSLDLMRRLRDFSRRLDLFSLFTDQVNRFTQKNYPTEIKVDLPLNAKLTVGRWSPDASHFTFTNTTNSGIELWIGDTTGKTRKVEGVRVNAVMGGGRGGDGAEYQHRRRASGFHRHGRRPRKNR